MKKFARSALVAALGLFAGTLVTQRAAVAEPIQITAKAKKPAVKATAWIPGRLGLKPGFPAVEKPLRDYEAELRESFTRPAQIATRMAEYQDEIHENRKAWKAIRAAAMNAGEDFILKAQAEALTYMAYGLDYHKIIPKFDYYKITPKFDAAALLTRVLAKADADKRLAFFDAIKETAQDLAARNDDRAPLAGKLLKAAKKFLPPASPSMHASLRPAGFKAQMSRTGRLDRR